ncbi:MAG: DNA polymerase III subunit gamma/tau [Alteromonadaceae bacterium]|nr:DNA polymerase III subunit gamma/tau [Alteromonadaceae bacterium]
MGYQVLARKWRPGKFSELVGQEHVVTAISNALANNRLHHAYLFTGTRGVGKTTIARIFAKSLNCEKGVTQDPCGQCGNCLDIEAGRFVDLLEIDAASRTKVEDTRELLDNVQYSPTRGDYKIYLIDEVHMLSKHSFNALLKTLEEPPPHVKFLLATTDPQKLPITILSRCLQFNLKALSRQQIAQQLLHILPEEDIQFEKEAVLELAKSASGSMRDALSTTDQAIAQGNGNITSAVVSDMLGLMDRNVVIKLLHAVLTKDKQQVFSMIEDISLSAPDYSQLMAEMMSYVHQTALTQFVPDACKLENASAKSVYYLATKVPPEQLQLYYQILLEGRKQIAHVHDGKMALEMTVMRMMAFAPELELTSAAELTDLAQVESKKKIDVSAPLVNATPIEASPIETKADKADESEIEEPSENTGEELTEETIFSENSSVTEVGEQAAELVQDKGETSESDIVEDSVEVAEKTGVAEPDTAETNSLKNETATSDVDTQETPHAQMLDIEAQAAAMREQVPYGGADNAVQQQIEPAEDLSGYQALDTGEPDLYQEHDYSADSYDNGTNTGGLNTAQSALTTQNTSEARNKASGASAESVTNLLALRDKLIDLTQTDTEDADTPSFDESTRDFSAPSSEPEKPLFTNSVEELESALSSDDETELASSISALADTEQESMQDSANVVESLSDNGITSDDTGPEDESVDFEVPLFLEGTKVIYASQIDTWSQLLTQSGLSGLPKQVALHSNYSKNQNEVTLVVSQSQSHLLNDATKLSIEEALSSTLQQPLQVNLVIGEVKDTPFALQELINKKRLAYAKEAIQKDINVNQLCETFSAKVLEESIKPN